MLLLLWLGPVLIIYTTECEITSMLECDMMLELLESLNYISCEVVELELSEVMLVTGGHKLHTGTIRTLGALSSCDHQNEGRQLLLVLPSARQPHLPSHQRSGTGSHNPDMERTEVGLL